MKLKSLSPNSCPRIRIPRTPIAEKRLQASTIAQPNNGAHSKIDSGYYPSLAHNPLIIKDLMKTVVPCHRFFQIKIAVMISYALCGRSLLPPAILLDSKAINSQLQPYCV